MPSTRHPSVYAFHSTYELFFFNMAGYEYLGNAFHQRTTLQSHWFWKWSHFSFTFALVIYWRNRRRLLKKWWANQKALSFQFPGCCKAGCQGWCLFIALCWYRPYIWYFKPDLSTICLIIYLPFPNSADDVLEERQIWRLVLVGWNVMCLVVQKWCSQMRCWGTEFFRLFL